MSSTKVITTLADLGMAHLGPTPTKELEKIKKIKRKASGDKNICKKYPF
jgi:hypothetical protein